MHSFEDRSLPSDESDNWVNRDPFYRTLTIFNRQFKKNLVLQMGQGVMHNSTDCETTIFLNVNEKHFRDVIEDLGDIGGRRHYRLECGHERSNSKPDDPPPSKAPCWRCGEKQAYLGFSHELQHVVFKSNPLALRSFAEEYAKLLGKRISGLNEGDASKFIYKMGNAFDDIRCNSLDQRFHYGTAVGLWDRWKYYTIECEKQGQENFIQFIFARHFNLPLDPQNELAPYAQIVKDATTVVQGCGFLRMLSLIRKTLDSCIEDILRRTCPPPPQQQPQPPPPPQQQNQQGSQPQPQGGMGSSPDQGDDDDQDQQSNQGGSPGQGGRGQQNQAGGQAGPQQPPAAPTPQPPVPNPQDVARALQKLMDGANDIDPDEQHASWDVLDALARQHPELVGAAFQQAKIGLHGGDPATPMPTFDQDNVDPDLQQTFDQLSQDPDVDKDSVLTTNAKARLTIIDVLPGGIRQFVEPLTPTERMTVERMRSSFYRTLGKVKMERQQTGINVDIQAYIQHRISKSDPEIFDHEDQTQGFVYSILCDMSGSMAGDFGQVCRAVEMLKAALKFPFVKGDLWGFRGGQTINNRPASDGEVWLYRYDPNCRGYIGEGHAQRNGYALKFPVNCNGITPMNSSIHVVVNHLQRKPQGCAKRMFLLTDGSPMQMTTKGRQIPTSKLRGFVAKEVMKARRSGIQVYVILIGDGISDHDALFMFGNRKNWRRVSSGAIGAQNNSGGQTLEQCLTSLVIENFTRYLNNRG